MPIPVPAEALTGLTWPDNRLTTLLPKDAFVLSTGNRMTLRVERGEQTLRWFVTGEEELDLGAQRTPETMDRWMREIAGRYGLDATLHVRRPLFSVYHLRSCPAPIASS